ncbi:hypothetical protein GCM10010372_39020 [Streptomyces tauricus]|nr:hypothetical protein GCM10010372_39020 [Streptomyces tauricus]
MALARVGIIASTAAATATAVTAAIQADMVRRVGASGIFNVIEGPTPVRGWGLPGGSRSHGIACFCRRHITQMTNPAMFN